MIELPDAHSHLCVADWIEIHLATSADAISKAELSSIIEGSTGEEASDAFLSSVWNELSIRQERYFAPSFGVAERRINRVNGRQHRIEYIACLILSLFGAPDGQIPGKLFERLSALALQEYVKGEVFLFGWPVLDGTEIAIGQRVREAAGQLGERFAEAPARRYLDRGVDIIAWKKFGERRSSQFIILAQCAAGKHWQNKTRDLPKESWEQYIHWACNFVTAFFVPCIIPDSLWHDISREAGILFDRVRIINFLPNGITDPQLSAELSRWAEGQLTEFSVG